MTQAHETEGVIKYALDYTAGPAVTADAQFRALDAWRTVLHKLDLVGQDPARYDGYGFGNVSARTADGFVISGTQTGAPEQLGPAGYALVTGCDPARNAVTATGPVRPSSESLTHGTMYALDGAIGCVLHAHAEGIWAHRHTLGLPETGADVPYGTPQMAQAVRALYETTDLPTTGVFCMAGHQDGVVAFGRTANEAGARLITAHSAALAVGMAAG